MISAEQIRAARALLDWSTAELARRTGFTINGLNKIERRRVSAQLDTLETIRSVFEQAGLEFLPGSGVRRKSNMIVQIESPDANRQLAADIYEHLKRKGGELLIMHADEEMAVVSLGPDFMEDQIKKRKAAGITHKIILSYSGAKRYQQLDDCYHTIDDTFFSRSPLFVYGSRFALLTPDTVPKVIIIDNLRMAESVRRLFNFVWDHTAEDISMKPRKKGRRAGGSSK